MKFLTLLKNELRICLPWLLLCTFVFIGIGSIMLKGLSLNQKNYINQGYNDNYGYYLFTSSNPIREVGPLILIIALALGIILAVIQFLLPRLFRTWSFTIHRSIKPDMIIWSKFAAAGITFTVSLGLLWTLFYLYASVPGRFYLPIFFKTYCEGWVYIFAGIIAYFGIALTYVSTDPVSTRWLIPVIAAAIIFWMLSASVGHALILAAIGAFILIVQIFYMFSIREY